MPLILTFQLDPFSHEFFTDLRHQYFPSERNFLDAHLTAFHLLPSDERETVLADLRDVAVGQELIKVQVTGLRSLGRGVAFDLQSPEALRLRAELASRWRQWLGPQDRQGFRPHITVQNKVPAEAARRTLDALRAQPAPPSISVIGFDLWEYLGGPWKAIARVPFVERPEASAINDTAD